MENHHRKRVQKFAVVAPLEMPLSTAAVWAKPTRISLDKFDVLWEGYRYRREILLRRNSVEITLTRRYLLRRSADLKLCSRVYIKSNVP